MPDSSTLRNSLGGLVNASADLRIRCVSSVRPTCKLLLALQRSRGSAQGLMTLQKLGKELLAGLLRELHQWPRRKRPASYRIDSTSRLTRTTIVTIATGVCTLQDSYCGTSHLQNRLRPRVRVSVSLPLALIPRLHGWRQLSSACKAKLATSMSWK